MCILEVKLGTFKFIHGLIKYSTNRFIDKSNDSCDNSSMKSYKASYFKAHFGAVLDHAGFEPVRIERRGREPSVVIPESKYRALRGQALPDGEHPDTALSRLRELALGPEAGLAQSEADLRSAAIMQKHS